MKVKLLLFAFVSAAFLTPHVEAQVFTENAVGYYNVNIHAGYNLIANQLSAADNFINTVLSNGVVTGSVFTKWDSQNNNLLPISVYDGSSWSINYDLAPDGIGGVLISPDPTTVTFVGDVVNINLNPVGDESAYTFHPPLRASGRYLLALAAPLENATFQQIVGRLPVNGEAVTTLDAATQNYTTTTFNGSVWNNGTPLLDVGESAYFDLVVPEPSALALTTLGATCLLVFRRTTFPRK